MELPGGDDLLEGRDGRRRAAAREVLVDVALETRTPEAASPKIVHFRNRHGIDDDGARFFEIGQRLFESPDHLRVCALTV